MPELVYIRLGNTPDASVSWTVLDEDGRRAGADELGSLDDAAAATEGRRVRVLVPAMDVVSTEASLPATSQARLRQMLPYSLEDALAHDVEKLWFAAGPRLESGAVSVAVVARERLAAWLAALAEAGIQAQTMYSEAEGVPDTPGTLTLIMEGERIYGRRPGRPPFVVEGLGLGELLELLGTETPDAPELRHLLVFADEPAGARHQRELAELRERLASADMRLLGDGVTARLAVTLAQCPGTNLLQGPYAPQSNWRAVARPWRVAAGLLVALGVLGVSAQVAEYLTLKRSDEALTAQLAAACERQFGVSALSACDGEVRRALQRAGESVDSSETFLSALAAVAASQHPATRIEGLSYQNRNMSLQLIAPSVSALDEFSRKMAETQRFAVSIQRATSGEDGVEGRVQVVEAGR